MKRTLLISAGMVPILLLAGCYVTVLTLGSKDEARVSRAYVGDWQAIASEVRLVVRLFSEQEYYAEFQQPGEAPLRMAGYIIPVEGVDFAHLRELSADGSVRHEHVIVRVAVQEDRLTLRHLRSEFFEDVETNQELREYVAANLENRLMYQPQAIAFERIRE